MCARKRKHGECINSACVWCSLCVSVHAWWQKPHRVLFSCQCDYRAAQTWREGGECGHAVCVCVCVCVGENGREREVREGSLQRARGQAVDTRSISLLLSLFLSLFHTHTHALRCTHTQGYSEVI